MANPACPDLCEYCGQAPCVGADCPANWADDDNPFYSPDDDHEDDWDEGGWEPCWYCGGQGGFHDCGEDCCCCARPELDEVCPECAGEGGWHD